MNDVQQRAAAKHFADYWKGKGYEKGDSQKFWLSLLTDVFGVEHAAEFISFEDQVHLDHTSFIDGYIPATHVLIEQKSIGKSLSQPIRQSDGSLLKPIEQAKRYANELPYSQRPRWIVISNFECFHVYDMEHPQAEAIEIKLEDLPEEYYRLEFLVKTGDANLQREMQISFDAGKLVGKLYDAFLKEYRDPTNEHSLKSLNALCVRLVFCLYAEDAGIFGRRLMFHDYLQHNGISKARQALIDLFRVLDTKIEDRDPYMDDELASFPYVNGGLFSDENIEIPRINETIFDLLLNQASAAFNWSEISPTIFGAVFESTLNPETRRSGGMHYTSIENIHKVIDPLFLDALKTELEDIKAIQQPGTRKRRLEAYQNKLASLKFLDPAAGSGNFLTESYLCLRRLENEVIDLLQQGQIVIGEAINPIKVSIAQFYGIEINDFAVTVAKTALWIAESQMLKRTEDIVHLQLDFLPLKSYVNIVEGNALRIDWNDVIPARELSYIMGNPPFVGARIMTKVQKEDINLIFAKRKGAGNLDYVSAWYEKATDYISGTRINAAFVSTNSITQGEQATILWQPLMAKGVVITFAWTTFKWGSESNDPAAVSCVIVGFSVNPPTSERLLFQSEHSFIKANNINAYLLNAPNIFVTNRANTLCNAPAINYGSFALDDGNYTISEKEYSELIAQDETITELMRPFIGAQELLHKKKRFCVWLKGVSPSKLNAHPLIKNKVALVQEWRSKSSRQNTVALAETPTLFAEVRQPDTMYLAIPTVCSEKRRYIPMAFLTPDIIASNQLYIVGNADIYHFGVLMSNVHMAWMRAVCGRLELRYRYSSAVVYNNFPWPNPTAQQQERIRKTAQAIIDARALYPDSSLAELYDEVLMPPELRTAHQQNDRAVWEAYGKAWNIGKESECVAYLMKLYQTMTAAEGSKS